MNYTELVQQIQDETEYEETDFVSNIPNFVKRGEERILRDVDLPAFHQTDSAAVTAASKFLSTPAGFLYPHYLIVNGRLLLQKQVDWIAECYPTGTTASAPIYYSIWDENSLVLGPTPDQAYAAELRYTRQPESIVIAGTTWLGDNAELALFYSSLLEAGLFMRQDADVLGAYKASYDDALQKLSIFGELRMKKDEFKERSKRPNDTSD